MANEIIRPTQLPARADPVASEVVPSDNGATVGGVTWADGVNAAVPPASQPESEAGVINTKRMTPLTTKQAIDAQVPPKIGAAIGALNLDTMSQESASDYTKTADLAAVALSNDYGDLGNRPTLGSAAATDAADYATAAQGAKADTAVQPSRTVGTGTGLTGGGDLSANRTISLTPGAIASLSRADSSVQTVNGLTPDGSGNVSIDAEFLQEQDSVTTAMAESFAPTVQWVRTAGYSSAGDGGGALYKRALSEPSHAGKFQSSDGAWWEISENELNVLQFGAVADSTGVGVGTDNSPMFNSAMLAAISLRRNIRIPAGGYRLNAALTYNKASLNGDSGYVPSIRGDGVSMTRLFCSAGGIAVQGVTTAGIYGSFFNISDMYLRGNNASGIGIDIVACGFVGLNNVRSTQFGTGCRLKGVISSKLDKPFFDSNVNYGLQALPDDGNVMPPNAITVDQPWIGSNGQCGIELDQPATFNIRGGSVEGNGTNTVLPESQRGGIIIVNAGTGGHNAITSEGVYYEHNMGIADVLIYGSTRTFSANFDGNTFTRLGPTPVKHSIFATSATHNVTINLSGNGFGELGGGFVPTSGQRYIQVDGGANIYTVVDIGNQYMTAAARPEYQTCRIISNNTMPYAMGYCTAAGVLEGSAFNVQSITKVATGSYKINFGEAIAGRKFAVCSFGVGANFNVFTFDDTSITINIRSIAATPTLIDAEFGFVVYTTAWW